MGQSSETWHERTPTREKTCKGCGQVFVSPPGSNGSHVYCHPDCRPYWKGRNDRPCDFRVRDFKELLIKQGNACAICHVKFTQISHRHVHVDHDHETNTVRGILCQGCNLGIGWLNSLVKLQNALEYVKGDTYPHEAAQTAAPVGADPGAHEHHDGLCG